MMPQEIKAVIIDDERLARRGLEILLSSYSRISIVGQADSVRTGVRLLEGVEPDLVFLDVQMPDGSGFDVLDRVQGNWKIIFVTAYDAFAIRAFEVNALDYLLKPVNPERLAQALERIQGPGIRPWKEEPLEYDDYLFLTLDKQQRFLRISKIVSLKAAGDYSRITLTNGSGGLIHRSLSAWERRLPGKYFARIHRSMIVNLEQVERIEPWFRQSFRVFLRDKSPPVIMSRRYAARLKTRFS